MAKSSVIFIWNKIIYGQTITFRLMATMHPLPPPHPEKKISTKLRFSEPLEILNTKSTVNIENIGMQTLFRQSIYRISGKPICNCYIYIWAVIEFRFLWYIDPCSIINNIASCMPKHNLIWKISEIHNNKTPLGNTILSNVFYMYPYLGHGFAIHICL